MTTRPFEIKASHLARKAIIYVRQSSEAQVTSNQGSTAHQRAQRKYAEAWGWAEDQIEVIDDDLGLSGTGSVHRLGYQRMVTNMEQGHVGAVFVSDESRLGREPIELFRFVNLCMVKTVLLVVGGRVADLTDPAKFFQARLSAILGEYENLRRREHIRRGIEARVAAGKAVTRPPTGYRSTGDGAWELDPDPDVQTAITTVFRVFLQERSCPRTLRALLKMGLKIPRYRRGNVIVWVVPDMSNISTLLKNPRYTGRYVYRRQVCDPTLGRNARGQVRLRRGMPDEVITIENHHPPYVSPADWDEIQAILHALAPSSDRRNLGPGNAPLQGIVRCGQHGYAMQVAYRGTPRRDGERLHYYKCMGDYFIGGNQCGPLNGRRLDRAVVDAVLQRLSPPSIAAIRGAWKTAREHKLASGRMQNNLLDRARRRERDLEQRFMLVDPTHRLVADHLEAELERAKKERAALELAQRGRGAAQESLTEEDLDELVELSRNIVQLFHAPTTSVRDRKELIRTVAKHVIFGAKSPESMTATIVWNDSASDTPVRVPLDPQARRRIVELAAEGLSVEDIQQQLADEGYITRLETQWSTRGVERVLLTARS